VVYFWLDQKKNTDLEKSNRQTKIFGLKVKNIFEKNEPCTTSLRMVVLSSLRSINIFPRANIFCQIVMAMGSTISRTNNAPNAATPN
jgi:hypothetical protein